VRLISVRAACGLLAIGCSGILMPGLASTSIHASPPGQAVKVSAPFLLAGGAGNQGSPSMAGTVLAYTTCKPTNCDVYGLDLTTRQSYPISDTPSDEQQPATDGLRVVWRDARNTDNRNDSRLNNFDIYGSLLADKKAFPATRAAKMQNRPSVWGNVIVWADFRDAKSEDDQEAGDIYMYDIASGKETLISSHRSAQVRPVTNGRYIVWTDYRNEPDPNGNNADIYGYDLATGQEFAISKAPDTQIDAAMSGNIVVWTDFRKGNDDSDIYGYDLTTKKEFSITTAKGSQIQPAISGNIVVWGDFRNEADPKGTNSDIYGYDLNTKQEFAVYVGPATQGFPRVSGNTVAWEDSSKGKDDFNIMAATITGVPITTPAPAPLHVPGVGSRVFPETSKTLIGLFLQYWNNNGGLPQQGYPISEVIREVSDLDKKPYTVQYFERAVFEYHPENQPPFDVLLSQLGTFQYKKKYPNGAPNQSPNNEPGSVLVPETGKRLGGRFLQYWQTHGGLPQQGYPISDEFMERSDLDGKNYLVQYFERAVFEYHPENAGTQYEVLLSQLGTFQYRQKYGGK